jgi:hypothetical protein
VIYLSISKNGAVKIDDRVEKGLLRVLTQVLFRRIPEWDYNGVVQLAPWGATANIIKTIQIVASTLPESHGHGYLGSAVRFMTQAPLCLLAESAWLLRKMLFASRAAEICIGLQNLHLPVLLTLGILDEAMDNDFTMHYKWALAARVKHFK